MRVLVRQTFYSVCHACEESKNLSGEKRGQTKRRLDPDFNHFVGPGEGSMRLSIF